MNSETKRQIERTVFRDRLFTERIYSSDDLPDDYDGNKQLIDIYKQECGSYKSSGQLCENEECFNLHFFSRLENYNYLDRERFIKHQTDVREDKICFLNELSRAVYDSQNLFAPHVYNHIIQIIETGFKEENSRNGISTNHLIGNKVFIIHGQDEEMKKAVQLFINRLGLEDVVLHERANIGRTIISKLIEESNGACYAIALFSPDDSQSDGSKRARQNVILELGYFIGLIGIERVRILKKGLVDVPSDLQGVIYENYDQEGNWRIKLIKELEELSIEINAENVISKF